jgi:hypothetical protein
MPVKELPNLTITGLLKEYDRSPVDYWEMYDILKEFRKKFTEESIECRN